MVDELVWISKFVKIFAGRKRNIQGKSCPRASVSNTGPIYTAQEWNHNLRHEKYCVSNILNYIVRFEDFLPLWSDISNSNRRIILLSISMHSEPPDFKYLFLVSCILGVKTVIIKKVQGNQR